MPQTLSLTFKNVQNMVKICKYYRNKPKGYVCKSLIYRSPDKKVILKYLICKYFLLLKSYENGKIANNRLKGHPARCPEVDWWSHDAIVWKKWKNMVIFGAHTFVKYANNLYTPKMLSLKITITHYFGNMHISPKIKHKQHNVHNRELSISSEECYQN